MREHDAATAAYLQEVREIERELAAGGPGYRPDIKPI